MGAKGEKRQMHRRSRRPMGRRSPRSPATLPERVHQRPDLDDKGMTTHPLLSILTPAVPARLRQLEWLMAKIDRQIGDKPVEHLILIDNKRRTVGEKRDALL